MHKANARIFCAFLCLLAAIAPAEAETLTIATYNLENYGPADRMTESGFRKDYPKPEPEKRAVRTVIRALNADILILQEMGGGPYLDELRRDLKLEGLDYPHAALATASDADRHVAILAKRPLKNVATHAALDFSYFGAKERVKRGLLEATVATVAGDVTFFAVHLKSRFTDRPDDPMSAIRRAGEATAVRDLILKRFPAPVDSRFVILGDCNDGKASKPLGFLQKRGKTAIAELLPATDSRGEHWTHVFRREETYTHVDHILVSAALLPAVRERSARIYDGDGVRAASDHRPVSAVLVFEKK
jgi:endonuclease/exonuclease/phosphatase family metal-dependent hydrolase